MPLFDDNRRVGIGLCALGSLLAGLGILLFFDRVLLASANFAFLIGICFIVGPMGAGRFFLKREKRRGSFFFFGGLGVLLFGWAIPGILLQVYGIWHLFYALLPNIVASAKLTPVGFIFELPGIKQLANRIYDMRRLPL